MTSKAARLPSGTKASLSTVADSRAVGYCGWKAGRRNALALASHHYGRTGHHIICEVFYCGVWKADSEEALPLFPQEAEKPTAAE